MRGGLSSFLAALCVVVVSLLLSSSQVGAVNSCNESCRANAECDVDHWCYQGKCRLATNPTSTTCSPVGTRPAAPPPAQPPKGSPPPSSAPAIPTARPSPVATTSARITPSPSPTASPSAAPVGGVAQPTSVPVTPPSVAPLATQDPTLAEQVQNALGSFNILPIAIGGAVLLLILALAIFISKRGKSTPSNKNGSSPPPEAPKPEVLSPSDVHTLPSINPATAPVTAPVEKAPPPPSQTHHSARVTPLPEIRSEHQSQSNSQVLITDLPKGKPPVSPLAPEPGELNDAYMPTQSSFNYSLPTAAPNMDVQGENKPPMPSTHLSANAPSAKHLSQVAGNNLDLKEAPQTFVPSTIEAPQEVSAPQARSSMMDRVYSKGISVEPNPQAPSSSKQ